jgi:pimeloyl-ACP methyl ester carboxylesterase
MLPRTEADTDIREADTGTGLAAAAPDILLVMVPGMGMRAGDFRSHGLIAAVEQRQWPVLTGVVDPGPDSYLDGSVEDRLLDGIANARRTTCASRVWLAGISLGCQAILRCVRARPDMAEGLLLLTPYLASTGLIAEVSRAGGLRNWADPGGEKAPDEAFLRWLATAQLPRTLVGCSTGDRFASTAIMLAGLLPADDVVRVAGEHDWAAWRLLWRLVLDRDPFGQRSPVVC